MTSSSTDHDPSEIVIDEGRGQVGRALHATELLQAGGPWNYEYLVMWAGWIAAFVPVPSVRYLESAWVIGCGDGRRMRWSCCGRYLCRHVRAARVIADWRCCIHVYNLA